MKTLHCANCRLKIALAVSPVVSGSAESGPIYFCSEACYNAFYSYERESERILNDLYKKQQKRELYQLLYGEKSEQRDEAEITAEQRQREFLGDEQC